MSKVVLDITISLDGFIAGPNDDVERLHDWLFSGNTPSASSDFFRLSKESAQVFDKLIKATGAIVAGRRTYDIVGGWGGSHPLHGVPLFVVSSDVPKEIPRGSTRFTFVTDGIESAIRQAKAAAGRKNVYVLGGANVAQQCLGAGLLDEIQLHLVPVILCAGIRLFDHLSTQPIELETTGVIGAPGVPHLKYRIVT